ncbi:MAG: pyridoxal-phosphate dependent enzyme [Desulfitobacteriaceae bacterium]|nr:pyridoxal-phosphate dependent enzyme [Desulfitobacteriaceae bacterium]
MKAIPFGPTYEEMLYPDRVSPDIRSQALNKLSDDEFDPINLFNITWKNGGNKVRKVVLPRELTGVEANIIVLLGKYFPSGSHKVGPAYATLMEGCVDGEILPGRNTILGPSSGNFGIGVAYICRLMGYESIIIVPAAMTRERVERIKKYEAGLERVSGEEAGMRSILKRTRELMKNPVNRALAQFELLPNYRFHRYVTGHSVVEAAQETGNGKIACFAVAPGSAGTIAAGDHVKSVFPEAVVAALEPFECPTLSRGLGGAHRIEGIGDNLCNLIHNLLTTDYVVLVHDDDCVKGLKIIQEGAQILTRMGVDSNLAQSLVNLFGVSGICNILGSIKMAKYLHLGPEDNVVTISTDGFDRYSSVLEDLAARNPGMDNTMLEQWGEEIFWGLDSEQIFDFRAQEAKNHLFKLKEKDWVPFGYSLDYLETMKEMKFWDREYERVIEYDKRIKELRK